jgi:exosortase/archaeosortase family protein
MNLPTQRFLSASALLLAAVWIWLRDPSWLSLSTDAAAIVLALPLALWLATPIRLRSEPRPLSGALLLTALAAFLAGIVTDLTLLLAIAWSLAAVERLRALTIPSLPTWRIGLLATFAFPWIYFDAQALGFAFRLSGAWVNESLFATLGFPVEREGTLISIDGLQVSVEAACSGLSLLQALFIGGISVAMLLIPQAKPFMAALLCIPLLAWLANTVRMVVITMVGLSTTVEAASGLFHEWGGLLVILLMLLLAASLFTVFQRLAPNPAD